MPTDRPASTADGDRERISRARQAAEELFKPKWRAAPAAPGFANAPPAAEQPPRRQPRIIMIPSLAPASAPKEERPAEPRRQRRLPAGRETPEIPPSQFGRIRALTSYGMTRAQVAKLYGVATDAIDRIVGPADLHQ